MILLWLIIVLLAGGIVAALVEGLDRRLPRVVAIATLVVDLLLMIPPVLSLRSGLAGWVYEFNIEWIPQLGIRFHLAMDGLSMLLVFLTLFLGILSLVGSWSRIEEKKGFFHLNVLWTLAGVTGVFLAMDLFLFYFFWELMLFPMYFLIAIWGHEDRFRASVKFFLFTQLSGLLMFMAIIGLYFVHGRATGVYSFGYADLLSTPMSGLTSIVLASGFLIAFLVKLPAVPFHTWLPDAHTQAPTAGSVILAGLLLKTGAYGLLRFVVPLFPSGSEQLSVPMMVLGVISILYGGVLVFAQDDVKRLVAYTSISHMGFVLLGAFSKNELALQGAVIMIICHALSTGALFMLVGAVQARLGTRDLARMGGFWRAVPRLGGVWLFFALASLGLPGLGNFVAEFMVLLGTWAVNRTAAIVGAAGFVVATIYALWMMHRIFFGQEREKTGMADLVPSEMLALGAMIAALVWIGLYPQPILNVSKQGLENIIRKEQSAQSRGHKGLFKSHFSLSGLPGPAIPSRSFLSSHLTPAVSPPFTCLRNSLQPAAGGLRSDILGMRPPRTVTVVLRRVPVRCPLYAAFRNGGAVMGAGISYEQRSDAKTRNIAEKGSQVADANR